MPAQALHRPTSTRADPPRCQFSLLLPGETLALAGAAVDAVTTSQSEADEKRGRAIRKQEEREGREARKRAKAERERARREAAGGPGRDD